MNKDTFNFWYPANIEKGSDGKMWISGVASTDDEDLQGERIKQNGLQMDYFLKRGYFNDDHSKDTGAKVGIPVEASITKHGLWVKGYLLDTARAKSIYELATALSKAGGERKLGFSVEGKVLSRDDKNPRIVTKAWIKDVAITASPINPNTFMDIAKSFASKDCTEIIVTEDFDEVEKGKKDFADSVDSKTKEDELQSLQEATKKPVVSQPEHEKEDAEKTTVEALSEKKPKKDLEKMITDVPIAKRAGKSISEALVTLEFDEEGNIVIKGLKLPKNDPAIIPQECKVCFKSGCQGHPEDEQKANNKTLKKLQESAGGDTEKDNKPTVAKNKTEVQKSDNYKTNERKCPNCGETDKLIQHDVPSIGGNLLTCQTCKTPFKHMDEADKSLQGDLEKGGFTVVNSLGGERDLGSKKVPIHTTTYGHKKSGHHIMVTGKEGAFAVVHMHKNPKGEAENLGSLLFVDQPEKGRKSKEDVDEHLKGFGIKHKFADKQKLLGKAIVNAQDESNVCEICKSDISKGNVFIIAEGHSFCDDACIEKALVSGYAFGVTDQANGGALRIESLEGSQHDQSYGKYVLNTNVKEVRFDSARANGGRTQVTLRDAVEFLTSRGLPQDAADRLLVLMIKNNGDISKLASKAKGGK
jgi:hypothetical protein